MQDSHWWFRTVHSHVRFEIAFGGERSAADLAFERTFTRMRSVVHLESALATEHPVTDNALVRIRQFVLDVVDELL